MITPISCSTVGTHNVFTFMGKSTDEKPISTNASKFIEMDTGDEYFFDGDEQGWSMQADNYLVSIEVTTAPTKVEYVDGEEFDATGMVVTATYTDNTTNTVSKYEVECQSPLSVSDTKVKIIYKENGRTRTAEQTITVVPVALASIAFTTEPTLAYNDGDPLDLTGAVVTATYNDASTKVVTESCTFDPADGATLTTTDTTLTATYVEGEITKTTTATLVVT